jgi:hypothetical protein
MCSQISLGSYYYLKDLKIVYYNCHGLPYGKEDQTLLINDEPSKALWNPKWNGFKKKSFRGQMLSKNKVQWLDLTSHLCMSLFELLLAETIHIHDDCMIKYFKACSSSSSKNYYWFIQYIDNDNGDVGNNHPPLGMESKSFHFASFFFCYNFYKLLFVSICHVC